MNDGDKSSESSDSDKDFDNMEDKTNPRMQFDIRLDGYVHAFRFELFRHKYPIFVDTFCEFVQGKVVESTDGLSGKKVYKFNLSTDKYLNQCLQCLQKGPDDQAKELVQKFWENSKEWEKADTLLIVKGELKLNTSTKMFEIVAEDQECDIEQLVFGRALMGENQLDAIAHSL